MVGGAAPHVGDQWFHKRAMSGELENTGRRWPGGERIWYSTVYEGVVCRFIATWRSMATWVKKRRGKCVRKPAKEERGRIGKQA